jgi:hypothetical protein
MAAGKPGFAAALFKLDNDPQAFGTKAYALMIRAARFKRGSRGGARLRFGRERQERARHREGNLKRQQPLRLPVEPSVLERLYH